MNTFGLMTSCQATAVEREINEFSSQSTLSSLLREIDGETSMKDTRKLVLAIFLCTFGSQLLGASFKTSEDCVHGMRIKYVPSELELFWFNNIDSFEPDIEKPLRWKSACVQLRKQRDLILELENYNERRNHLCSHGNYSSAACGLSDFNYTVFSRFDYYECGGINRSQVIRSVPIEPLVSCLRHPRWPCMMKKKGTWLPLTAMQYDTSHLLLSYIQEIPSYLMDNGTYGFNFNEHINGYSTSRRKSYHQQASSAKIVNNDIISGHQGSLQSSFGKMHRYRSENFLFDLGASNYNSATRWLYDSYKRQGVCTCFILRLL